MILITSLFLGRLSHCVPPLCIACRLHACTPPLLQRLRQLGRSLPGGYILVTGQSDFPASAMASELLGDAAGAAEGGVPVMSEQLVEAGMPQLWFAQNPDLGGGGGGGARRHPRLRALPIGVNCFEHGAEIVRARARLGLPPVGGGAAAGGGGGGVALTQPGRKDGLVFINFGDTSAERASVRSGLANSATPCTPTTPL